MLYNIFTVLRYRREDETIHVFDSEACDKDPYTTTTVIDRPVDTKMSVARAA